MEMKNTERERKVAEKERLRADMAQYQIKELDAELKKICRKIERVIL